MDPQINDVRFDDNGGMEYFDGHTWVPYRDPPAGPDLSSAAVIKGEPRAENEEQEADEQGTGGSP